MGNNHYLHFCVVSENNELWPILPHLWANTNSPTELFRYLDQAIASSPQANARNPLHSAMAQTTPTVLDILFLRGSLRANADAVNRNVTQRLATRWRHHANIVSSDFFLANDVVDLSIAISLERSRASLLWRSRYGARRGGLLVNKLKPLICAALRSPWLPLARSRHKPHPLYLTDYIPSPPHQIHPLR